MSHTTGNLKADGMYVVSEDGGNFAADLSVSSLPVDEIEENSRRLAACLKACEGLGTKQLENLPMTFATLLVGASRDYDELRKVVEEACEKLKTKGTEWEVFSILQAELDKDK